MSKRQKTDARRQKMPERGVVRLIVCLILIFAAVLIFEALLRYASSDGGLFGEKRSDLIFDDNGNVMYGQYDDFVTIGDTQARAHEILGDPDCIVDDQHIYGNSYLLMENGIVVGFGRNDPLFPVTIGFASNAKDKTIYVGDNAYEVVKKQGTPIEYLKHEWYYAKEKICFDDDYTVSGIFVFDK